MSLMHFSVKSVSRGRGSSAVGKAAYDARARLRDESRQKTYDYRARGGLEHAEILRPAGSAGEGSAWALDRSALWNAAEAVERRKDARVALEYVVALPHELNAGQRLALARRFAQSIADRHKAVVDLAVHSPPAGGDPRNYHAHLLSTTRELTDGRLERKTVMHLPDSGRRRLGLPPMSEEVKQLRRQWTELANEQLREAGIAARLDPRALREQGIDRPTQRTLPQAVIEITRRGGQSHLVEGRYREAQTTRRAELEGAPLQARDAQPALPAPVERVVQETPTGTIERQRAAAERWLAYREAQASNPTRALPSLERGLAPEHDLGAEP